MAEPQIEYHIIPSKQLQYAGSMQELASNLLKREIGFCTENKRCFIKVLDSNRPEDLIPLGGVLPAPADQISLLIGRNDGSSDWSKFETKKLGSGIAQSSDLWYKLDGLGFAAQRAEKDYQGHDIQAKLASGPGIEVDQKNLVVNLTERSTFQPYDAQALHGALVIVEGVATTKYQVRIGTSGTLGALVPIVGSNKCGWVLESISTAGELGWVKPSSNLRSDGTIDISDATDDGRHIARLRVVSGGISTDKIADKSVTKEKIADGSVGATQMDLRDILPLVVGENLSASLTDDILTLSAPRRSISNAGHVVDPIESPTWYITATYGDKQVRLDFKYVSWGCTVSLNAAHSENAWLVNASDAYMLSKCTCCTSESPTGTSSGGPSNSVQTLLGNTQAIGSSTNWEHLLTLFDSATTRPYVAVDFHVMLMFKQNNVSYVAEFTAALHYHNDTVHRGEAFSGIATLRIAEEL